MLPVWRRPDAAESVPRGAGRAVAPGARGERAAGDGVHETPRGDPADLLPLAEEVCGLTEDEAQRLKRLERENARLKALIAERDLEIEVLREIQ